MNTQFKKGIIEICILKIISQKDMYGFEIIDRLADLLDVNENTIYPILRRLTKQGLFTLYEKESNLGANRKYYKITDDGLEKLEQYHQEWFDFISSVNKILGGNDNE